jgi:serine/threonine protein kinase
MNSVTEKLPEVIPNVLDEEYVQGLPYTPYDGLYIPTEVNAYQVDRQICTNANICASVFEAHHLAQDDQRVAIKLFFEPNLMTRRRVTEEIQAHTAFSDIETIVSVVGVGEVRRSGLVYRYLATEYAAHGDLQHVIDEEHIDITSGAQILGDAAVALSVLHDEGLVHGDVKPKNILVNDMGHGWLADLGLVSEAQSIDTCAVDYSDPLALAESPDALHKSSSDSSRGTAGFMPLEVILAGKVTSAADVFALGVSMHDVIYGELPYRGNTMKDIELAMKHQSLERITRDRKIPTDLGKLVLHALDPNPICRPTAQEFADTAYGLAA